MRFPGPQTCPDCDKFVGHTPPHYDAKLDRTWSWFPCAWCEWAGDVPYRYLNDVDPTVVWDCPACGEENRDEIEDD